MKSIHRRLLKVVCGALALVLIAGCVNFALRWNDPINKFRRSLSDRRELRSDADEFGDHSRYISGRLAESRFTEMAELLGLSDKFRADPKDSKGWQRIAGEPWWDLPVDFDEQYADEGEGYSLRLGRSGDRVYYQYLSW